MDLTKIDFSKLEAQFSEGHRLLDPHTITSALMNRGKFDDVTAKERQAAKAFNFTQLYSPSSTWTVPENFLDVYTDEQVEILCKEFDTDRLGLRVKVINYFGGDL